jgi:F0F1-type ATP synthase epsilon subunit
MSEEKKDVTPEKSGVSPKPHAASDAAAHAKDKSNLLQAKVFAPFEIFFEGEAKGITAVNESGPFDILAHHKNFISMLVPCDLVVHTVDEDRTFKINRGLLHVKDSKVTVFLDV